MLRSSIKYHVVQQNKRKSNIKQKRKYVDLEKEKMKTESAWVRKLRKEFKVYHLQWCHQWKRTGLNIYKTSIFF